MENHLSGVGSALRRDRTILASDGVISGRRVTRRPPLSSKLYSCTETSSPALRSYSSTDSRTGASYSSKPCSAASRRQASNSQVRSAMSSGSTATRGPPPPPTATFSSCATAALLRPLAATGSASRTPSERAEAQRARCNAGRWMRSNAAGCTIARKASRVATEARMLGPPGAEEASSVPK
eukprot:scaffold2786_cov96-Isochrysis_galbana.AAC.2